MNPKQTNMIFMVRHAESESNEITHQGIVTEEDEIRRKKILDPGLTQKGLIQAEETAAYLVQCLKKRGTKHVHIMVSLYKRTNQTMVMFLNELTETEITFTVNTVDNLHEITEPGRMDRGYIEQGLIPDQNFDAFTYRVRDFTNDLKEYLNQKNSSNEDIVIFGHGLFMSVFLSYISTQEKYLQKSDEDSKYGQIAYPIPNASITSISYVPGYKTVRKRWEIYGMGYYGHMTNPTSNSSPVGCRIKMD